MTRASQIEPAPRLTLLLTKGALFRRVPLPFLSGVYLNTRLYCLKPPSLNLFLANSLRNPLDTQRSRRWFGLCNLAFENLRDAWSFGIGVGNNGCGKVDEQERVC